MLILIPLDEKDLALEVFDEQVLKATWMALRQRMCVCVEIKADVSCTKEHSMSLKKVQRALVVQSCDGSFSIFFY